MGAPSGQVVGKTQVTRLCGCKQDFELFAVDRFRAQRLAKLQKTRCPACAAKHNEEQQRAAAAVPKKGEAFQLLPPGTQVALSRRADGMWVGTLTAGGTKVEAEGVGPQGVTVTLARLWVTTRGPAAKPG
jgi:hypothetical protein